MTDKKLKELKLWIVKTREAIDLEFKKIRDLDSILGLIGKDQSLLNVLLKIEELENA